MDAYNKIDFTNTGGLYVYQETLNRLQATYSNVLAAIAANYGNKVILTGCNNDGTTISEGWVVLNGIIYPVVSAPPQNYLYIETITTDEQFDDGIAKPTYITSRLRFTSLSAGNYLFADFKRYPLSTDGTIEDVLNTIQNIFNCIIFEPTAIMSGCNIDAASLNKVTKKVKLSAGIAWFGGKYITVPAYDDGAGNAATYPAYLKPDGTWVTVAPAGDYIKFDYDTSQRYEYIMRRKSTRKGQVLMSRDPAELEWFDVTGAGFGPWKDFKINDDAQSRNIIGYDRRSSGDLDGAWNVQFRTVGNKSDNLLTRFKYILQANLPAIGINLKISKGHEFQGGSSNDAVQGIGRTLLGGGVETVQTENLGNGNALDTTQPYAVFLLIEKIV